MQIVPLGLIQPNATATAVNVNANTILSANKLKFQSVPAGCTTLVASTAPIYIGSSALDIATGAGVIKVLEAGDEWSFGDERDGNLIDLASIFVKAQNATDGVLVCAFKR